MLSGKVATPSIADRVFWPSIYEQALNSTLTLFYTQPGYFWSDGLMAMLNVRNRAACWLRLEPVDRDPAGLLLSFIAAAQRIEPEIGKMTLATMRASPGPLAGWGPLYAQLGQEFVEGLPGNCVLVFEHVQHLAQAAPLFNILMGNFLPWVTRRFPCLLTSEAPISVAGFPMEAVVHQVNDLRLDFRSAVALSRQAGSRLAENCIDRALQTNHGQAVALAGLCAAGDVLDPYYVEKIILQSENAEQLFSQLARSIIANTGPGADHALSVACHLAYSHPNLISASLGKEISLAGPWLQPLSEGWARIRQIWATPIKSILQTHADVHPMALLHAADFLFAQGMVNWAIRLYFECSAMDSAARAIAGVVDNFIDLGLWQTLDGWLEQLPQETLEEWPRLIYVQGEIAALTGNPKRPGQPLMGPARCLPIARIWTGFARANWLKAPWLLFRMTMTWLGAALRRHTLWLPDPDWRDRATGQTGN